MDLSDFLSYVLLLRVQKSVAALLYYILGQFQDDNMQMYPR